MSRAAILMVPMEWILTHSGISLSRRFSDISVHHAILRAFGCSDYTVKWLDFWCDDFLYNAILYRFLSEEETKMPIWEAGCRPMFVVVEELNVMCSDSLREDSGKGVAYKESGIALSKGRRIERF